MSLQTALWVLVVFCGALLALVEHLLRRARDDRKELEYWRAIAEELRAEKRR